MPSPGLWPAPTTMAILSFRRISIHSNFLAKSRNRVLLQYFLVIRLVVDLHGGEHAHDGAIEGDGEHEIDHLLIGKMPLDLGKGRHRHLELPHHFARAF